MSCGCGWTDLDDVVARVARHRRVRRALAVPYTHLPSLATDAKNRDKREYRARMRGRSSTAALRLLATLNRLESEAPPQPTGR